MPTFFVSDERMLLHCCEWDYHIEKPLRLKAILDTLKDSGVMEKCEVLESKVAKIEDIELVHSAEYFEKIRRVTALNLEEIEKFCQANEDIYMNSATFDCAILSVGCAVEVMEKVLKEPGSNAFAAVRPPGHHASRETPCGFCIFNNVAICAKKARKNGINRVLIVDWDIHPGQGTQYCVEDDPGIKLVSIHRFENGHFWPELAECAVIQQYKNTLNVPLNEIGYGDAEYAAIMNFLVLPLIDEWKPELILVSCGFDAALGDSQGEMAVSPVGYGYMTGVLAGLGIPLCLLLEGGYFIESVAQGALYSVQALLDKKIPSVRNKSLLMRPSKSLLTTLFSTLSANARSFAIFADFIAILNTLRTCRNHVPIESPSDEYKGSRDVQTFYETRELYQEREASVEQNFYDELYRILAEYQTSPDEEKRTLNLVLSVENGSGLISGENFPSLKIHSARHLAIIYFYVLVPLSFAYELSINGKDVFSMELPKFTSKLNQKSSQQKKIIMEECVEQFNKLIDSFECLKYLFLFSDS